MYIKVLNKHICFTAETEILLAYFISHPFIVKGPVC